MKYCLKPQRAAYINSRTYLCPEFGQVNILHVIARTQYRTAQELINEAFMYEATLDAICGKRFKPVQHTDPYEMCQNCLSISSFKTALNQE